MTLSLAACGGSSSSDTTDDTTGDTSAAADTTADDTTAAAATSTDEVISLTLWGAEEDQDYLAERVEAFEETYADYATFDIQIGVESESTAKDTVLTDIEAAADVFAFADDQLVSLVNAGALLALDDNMSSVLEVYAGKTLDDVKADNVEVSIEAATYNDTLYAFPTSADNGFFLFYDSSVLSEEDVASWDSLLAAAEAAGKQVGMTISSGWYNAGFFYGAGFTTGLNDDGTTSIDWDGTSSLGYTGVDVVKGMLNIASSSAFLACADGDVSNQIASGSLCAAVSGTWDAEAAQAAFGDGYAATKLPTFTCADDQVQMGSVAGCKLMGVNAYCDNAGWAVLLAEFLTNEESQTRHFELREIGPSNINAQASDEVASNVALNALAEQSEFATIQSVGDKYWDPTATFGEIIAQQQLSADDDAAIQSALDDLVSGVTAAIE